MRNRHIWSADKEETQVLADWRGDGNRTVAFSSNQFPVAPWAMAQAMNNAFAEGYRAAQEDIRSALGVKP